MIGLPAAVRRGVENAIGELGGGPLRIRSARPLGGGCINPSARIEVENGETFFIKWNEQVPWGTFAAEADGLRALARLGKRSGLRVPQVLGVGTLHPSAATDARLASASPSSSNEVLSPSSVTLAALPSVRIFCPPEWPLTVEPVAYKRTKLQTFRPFV